MKPTQFKSMVVIICRITAMREAVGSLAVPNLKLIFLRDLYGNPLDVRLNDLAGQYRNVSGHMSGHAKSTVLVHETRSLLELTPANPQSKLYEAKDAQTLQLYSCSATPASINVVRRSTPLPRKMQPISLQTQPLHQRPPKPRNAHDTLLSRP